MSYVYFIRGELTGLVKIGIAQTVENRLYDKQVGSPDKLILLGEVPFRDFVEARQIEKRLHIELAGCRVHGEWFRPNYQLSKLLQRIERSELRRTLGCKRFDKIVSRSTERIASTARILDGVATPNDWRKASA